MLNFDLILAIGLFSVTAALALAYGLRVLLKGKARYDRVDRQGGSALLSKQVMEGAYWCLQPLARLLVFLRITPNQLSWSSFVLGLISGACLSVGHFGSAAVFSAISALLDSLDGMVARMSGVASDAGEVLDAAVDRYAEFFFIGGLVIYYRSIPVLMVVALLALMGSFMVSYSTAKAEALQIEVPKGSMRRPERAVYLTLGAALSPVTIPWWEVIPDFPVPVGHPMVFALTLVAVLGNVSAVERLWAIAKTVRLREREALRNRAKAGAQLEGSAVSGQHSDDEESAHHTARVR
jgi:phosphatidylglycerophosphate synthase